MSMDLGKGALKHYSLITLVVDIITFLDFKILV